MRSYARLLFAALAAACLLYACGSGTNDSGDSSRADSASPGAQTPVVLIIIDTLRADHLSCYGYEHETSPVIDAFAENAYVFEANSTQCNSTLPSITSIMTGLYPRTHRNYLPVPIDGKMELLQGHTTLAERMKQVGYHTLAVISHPFWNSRDTGAAIRRGWDHYSVIPPEIEGNERLAMDNAGYANERVFGLLDEYDESEDGPLMLWAHYFDPHNDYAPPREWQTKHLRAQLREFGHEELYDQLAAIDLGDSKAVSAGNYKGVGKEGLEQFVSRCMYDAEISYCDSEIGRLFDRLRDMGIYDEALIVLMSDHGENMGNLKRPGMRRMGMNHRRLFEGVVHVPLIIKLPHQTEGARISTITQSIDVMPTIVELLDLEAEPEMEGVSLRPLMDDPESRLHERVFMQSSTSVEKAVRTDDLKFIDPGDEDDQLLYSWRKDTDEMTNLVEEIAPDDRARLAQFITDFSPVDILRARLMPDTEPYEIDVVISSSGQAIEHVLTVEGGTWSAEDNSYRWRGTVGEEPIDLHLFLNEGAGLLRMRAEREGSALRELVWVGQKPVHRTTAIPIYHPNGEKASGARLTFTYAPKARARSFDLLLRRGEHALIEVRNRGFSYQAVPELIDNVGFTDVQDAQSNGIFKLLKARGPGEVKARIRFSENDDAAIAWLRLNGGWPETHLMRIEGQGVREDVIEFLIPYRRDKRLTATLLAGLGREEPAPGSLFLWLEGGASGAEIDTSELSEDEVDQLRQLGYVR